MAKRHSKKSDQRQHERAVLAACTRYGKQPKRSDARQFCEKVLHRLPSQKRKGR
jgi:hypothetical protein